MIPRLFKGKLYTKNSIYTVILFKSILIIYMMFFIVWHLTTPTTAYLNDAETHHATLLTAEVFKGEREEVSEEDTSGDADEESLDEELEEGSEEDTSGDADGESLDEELNEQDNIKESKDE